MRRRAALAIAPACAWALLGAPAAAQRVGAAAAVTDASERVTRATAVVLVGGAARARGVVLEGDGRVVTALAPLGGARLAAVRYADGRTDAAAVVATDPRWGVALLQPAGAYWREGLALAAGARPNAPTRWTAGDAPPRSVAGLLRRRRTYVGSGGELLRDAWEFEPAPTPQALGSGAADARGALVALVVPAAEGVPAGGAPGPFGAPADVLEALRARAGLTARAWLGLVARAPRAGDAVPEQSSDAGAAGATAAAGALVVTSVSAGGPAARAGLRAGLQPDHVAAIDGRPVRTTADLAGALAARHPGDVVVLRVARAGTATRDVRVVLGAVPGQDLAVSTEPTPAPVAAP